MPGVELDDDLSKAFDLVQAFSEIEVENSSVTLVKRLGDLLLLPPDQVTPLDRSLVDEILVRVLDFVDVEQRVKLATRISGMTEPPHQVLAKLAADEIKVAAPILEKNTEIRDSDLVDIIRRGNQAHRLIIAARKNVQSSVADALVDWGERDVLITLVKNDRATLSLTTLQRLVGRSRYIADLQPVLAARADLHPALGFAMFWWLPIDLRAKILTRFHISRRLMQQAIRDAIVSGDIDVHSYDPVQQVTLDFIQSNRTRLDKDEPCVMAHLKTGRLDLFLTGLCKAGHISHQTLVKVLRDKGGEPMAVLCKAAGLARKDFVMLISLFWKASNRDAELTARLPALSSLFDSLPLDSAELILRYWDKPRLDFEGGVDRRDAL